MKLERKCIKIKFTILGSKGFIGSHLVKYLNNKGIECHAPEIRDEDITHESLGHVIYSVGVPNFKERPFDAVDAHVCALQRLLRHAKFDSFLYLSGTRIYHRSYSTDEDSLITLDPTKLDDLYNISKIMGESFCLSSDRPNIRIARLSNVSGNNFLSDLFLPSIIRDAVDKKKITVYTKLDSQKDYVYIDDVVQILSEISLRGKFKIYNVASGKNLKSREIIDEIVHITGCQIEETPNAKEYSFPIISIDRIQNEFGFKPSSILDEIESMVMSYKKFRGLH